MTKLGKSDLLRLLSILEGELEAQDIFIADLQVRPIFSKISLQSGLSDVFYLALLVLIFVGSLFFVQTLVVKLGHAMIN